MCERINDVHESIGVQWSWSFLVETYQRDEDFYRSSLESSRAGDLDKRCVRELKMTMSSLESYGAGVLLLRHVRELRISTGVHWSPVELETSIRELNPEFSRNDMSLICHPLGIPQVLEYIKIRIPLELRSWWSSWSWWSSYPQKSAQSL